MRPVDVKAPASTAERCAVARAFRHDYGVRLPMLVDAVRARWGADAALAFHAAHRFCIHRAFCMGAQGA